MSLLDRYKETFYIQKVAEKETPWGKHPVLADDRETQAIFHQAQSTEHVTADSLDINTQGLFRTDLDLQGGEYIRRKRGNVYLRITNDPQIGKPIQLVTFTKVYRAVIVDREAEEAALGEDNG